MKNIVLLGKTVVHYRIDVYNYFSAAFLKNNYNFIVIANKVQKALKQEIFFNLKLSDFNLLKYIDLIKKSKPSFIINLLNLSYSVLPSINWPIVHWLKLKKIPIIYWNHAVNLQDPNNIFKNVFFNYFHTLSDAIILYSENQLKYISKNNRKKVFIANNTLNFNSFHKIKLNKETLRRKYNIPYKKVVLFVGRIQPRKRLEHLLSIFKDIDGLEYGLIVIGPNLSKDSKEIIRNSKNIMYFGEIYNKDKINEFFKLSDVFSIPGTNGLGLVHAFYWGLPVVTEDVRHSPEIMYLKNGINGFIVSDGDIKELKDKIFLLLDNKNIYKKFSYNAKKTIKNEASIEAMFNSFLAVIKYCEKVHK